MGICQRVHHTPDEVHEAQLLGSGLLLLGGIVPGQQVVVDCYEMAASSLTPHST